MKHKRLLLICILATCIALATQAWAAQDPPTNVLAARGNGMAAVSFVAPAAESGTTINNYTVTAYTSNGTALTEVTTATGTSSPIVVRGLANGTLYTFEVTANDANGDSSPSSDSSNFVQPQANGFAVYAGTWHGAAMSTGAPSPWGQTCTNTLAADGSLSMDCTDVDGVQTQYNSCHAWIFPYGMTITCDDINIPNNFLCYLNTACTTTKNGAVSTVGTVMACTQSENVNGSNESTLTVAVRQGSGYALSNLNNTYWFGEGLAVQSSGSDFWEQEIDPPIHILGSTPSGTGTKSNGSTVQIGGTLTLGSDGLLQDAIPNVGTASWYLDSGQTVAAGFTGYVSGDNVELSVLSKRSSGNYTSADLAGYWAGNKLKTNGTWQRMLFLVDASGSFLTTELNSDGSTQPGYGKLDISSGGLVTCDKTNPGDCTNLNAVMDASKTVITETETKTGSSSSTYSMMVLTKVKAPWANAVDIGNGWVWVRSYGYFYTDSAPWIYWGGAHGWLYPFVDLSGNSWFWDENMGTYWWTNQALYPYLTRADNGHWLWYNEATSQPRTFVDLSNGNNKLHINMNQ